ncbi:hypothetical protein BAT02nite_23460 [Bacillus atrophaeus]|nr:hypothetical protein BAT02nite_23460 [Bacillus atrophaeus]
MSAGSHYIGRQEEGNVSLSPKKLIGKYMDVRERRLIPRFKDRKNRIKDFYKNSMLVRSF